LLSQNTIFYIPKNWQDVYTKLDYELWEDSRSLELGLIIYFFKSTKSEDFVCDEYIWTKIIFVVKYKKW